MADYTLTGYLLSDFTGLLADPAHATETVGNMFTGTTVSLDPDAERVSVSVSDDDSLLQDAYIESGALSTLADDFTANGTTYPAGVTHIECEFRLVTDDAPPITFYIGRLGTGTSNSGENLLVFADAPLDPGSTYTFTDVFDGPEVAADVICFAAGTRIDTLDGPVAVEQLCAGDIVLTRDSGAQPILWTGQRKLHPHDLLRAPHLAPIRIRAGALGRSTPCTDLVVSPQHRIVIDDWRAEHYFGETSILAPAKALCNGNGVTIEPAKDGVIYCHILLERHELVRANGHWAETLLLGPQARSTLGIDQVTELEEFFPGLLMREVLPACPIVSASECAVLAG